MTRRVARIALVLASGLLRPVPLSAAPFAPAAPQAGGPAPNDGCFIRGLFVDLLRRPPTPGELTAGLVYLGGHTRDLYAGTLLTADEYRTLLIQGWYPIFLHRPADPGGLAAGLTLFHGGHKDEDVIAVIVGSNEYFAQPGIDSNNVSFVKAVYHDLLGRNPMGIELSNWLLFLGTNTIAQMAQVVLVSTEYRTDIIQSWYQRYLRRPATNNEVTVARITLNGLGGNDEMVIAGLLGSAEYYARAGLCALYLPLVAR